MCVLAVSWDVEAEGEVVKDNDRVLITPLYAAFQERWFMEVGKKRDQKAASDDANLIHSGSR